MLGLKINATCHNTNSSVEVQVPCGYPESPIAGDSGYFASIEYRMPVGAIEHLSSLGTLNYLNSLF